MSSTSQISHAVYGRPGIHGLALELLTEVFRLSAHGNHRHTTSLDVPPNEWLPKVHRALGSISLVCRQWREIIIDIPMFWITVVGYIDGHTPPELYIPLFVSRSKNLALSVYISRKDMTPPALNIGEREVVYGFLKALLGNFDRVSTLSIQAYERSSLPDAGNFFSDAGGPFPRLTSLVLHSDIDIDDDTLPDNPSALAATHHPSNDIPPLQVLSINGRDLLRLLNEMPDLRSSLQNLKTLAISQSRFHSAYFPLQQFNALLEFVSSLPHLSTLAFDSLQIENTFEFPRASPLHVASTSIRQLVLYNMATQSITHILTHSRNFDQVEVILVGCVFTHPLQLTADSCKRTRVVLDEASTADTSVELRRGDFELISDPLSSEDVALLTKLSSLLVVDCRHFSRAVQIAHVAGLPDSRVPLTHRVYYLGEFDDSETESEDGYDYRYVYEDGFTGEGSQINVE